MPTRNNDWVFVALVLAGLWLGARGGAPSPPGPPSGLRAAVTSRADAARLSAFYSALAGAIERDSTVVKTTGVFRLGRQNATLVAFQGTDLAGKYNLTAEIDRRITTALGGMQDQPLDAAKRTALVASLKQIAAELN